ARYLDWNYGATNLPRPNVTWQFGKMALLGNLFATLHKPTPPMARTVGRGKELLAVAAPRSSPGKRARRLEDRSCGHGAPPVKSSGSPRQRRDARGVPCSRKLSMKSAISLSVTVFPDGAQSMPPVTESYPPRWNPPMRRKPMQCRPSSPSLKVT